MAWKLCQRRKSLKNSQPSSTPQPHPCCRSTYVYSISWYQMPSARKRAVARRTKFMHSLLTLPVELVAEILTFYLPQDRTYRLGDNWPYNFFIPPTPRVHQGEENESRNTPRPGNNSCTHPSNFSNAKWQALPQRNPRLCKTNMLVIDDNCREIAHSYHEF